MVPVGSQAKRDSSVRMGFGPSVRAYSPSRKASSEQFQNRHSSKAPPTRPTTVSPPPSSHSVGYFTASGEELLKEVGYCSTAMQTARPYTPSSMVAGTGHNQHASILSVKDQNFGAFLNLYHSLNSGQQCLLLRQIRFHIKSQPFIARQFGCKSLIRQMNLILGTLEVHGQNIPDHIRGSVYGKSHNLFQRLFLQGVDKYNLYRLVFKPHIREQAHIAAVMAIKMQEIMASVLANLKELGDNLLLSWTYVLSNPACTDRAELYTSWHETLVRTSIKLKTNLLELEESFIECTSKRVPWRNRLAPPERCLFSIIPDRSWVPPPNPDGTALVDPAAVAVIVVDRPLSKSLHNSISPNNTNTSKASPFADELHASDDCTSRGSTYLNFTPSITLHESNNTHTFQSQIVGVNITMDIIGQKLENEDQAVDDQPAGQYHIPEVKLKEAMLSSQSTTAAYWRYSLYEHPTKGKVKVHYCKSKETTERTAQLFLGKDVVGFDIEWKPQAQATDGLKKNVSLIQLASEERIALFHIARYPKGETVDDFLAPTLKSIMEDPNISKVGVSVKSDCTRLRKFMGIESRGLFELSHLYKLVKLFPSNVKKIDKRLVSLAQQVEEHLQLPLWKGEVRSSDWSTDLNYQQMQYAASDSYAGLQLYLTMESKRMALDPTPPRPHHAELNLPISLASGQIVDASDEAEDTTEKTECEEAQDPSEKPADDAPLPAPSIEEMAREFMDIAIEDSEASKASAASSKPPAVATADIWVAEYRISRLSDSKTKATPAFLRAYSLWHHQEVEVLEAAKLLRDPPLQSSTVCCYILEAVRIEKLPFVVERLRNVLKQVEGTSGRRYQALKKLVE